MLFIRVQALHRWFRVTTKTVFLFYSTCVFAQLSPAEFVVPRTIDGAPDLQGMWTNNTITPLQRDEHWGEKLILTPEEALNLERQVSEFSAQQDEPSNPDRTAPKKSKIDLEDSYNDFWFDDGTLVAEYNGEFRSSLIIDPTNGRLPQYNSQAEFRIEAASKRRESIGVYAGPEARPLAERCLLSFSSSGGPPMLPILYNNHYQIVQSPGYVVIHVEMVHDTRIIRINDTPLPSNIRPWLGDSLAHWENNTLVVETSNFHPLQHFRNSSESFKIEERFTRVAKNRINYEFTVSDPETWSNSWSAEIPLNTTQEKLYEYACHEGNYSLPGVLAGARRAEASHQ